MKKSPKKLIAKLIIGMLLAVSATGLVNSQVMRLPLMYGWQAMPVVAHDLGVLLTGFTSNLSSFSLGFAERMSQNYERTIGLIKLAISQEMASSRDIAETIQQSGQVLVAAIQQQKLADDTARSVADVHPDTGQGYVPCATLGRVKTLDLAFDVAKQQAERSLEASAVGPGRMVPSRINEMQRRRREHLEQFCSQAEAEAGLCTESELPGGDVNAAHLFEPAEADSLKANARKAYLEHLMGEPDQRTTRAAGGTVSGEEFFMEKNRKDALLSVPAYSLAVINESNTRRADFNQLSANELMQQRVEQYFGGEEASAWAGSMARQRMRGLLAEANRIASLENWMLHKDYQRSQRLEANLAALAILSVENNKGRTNVGSDKGMVGARSREVQQ